jgi:hypothetical protein
MSQFVSETGKAVNVTGTADVVTTTNCVLLGFYVNSTNAGTLVMRRGGSGGTAISGTITPAIGFHRFPANCPGGLHATVGGTALDVTFFVVEGAA